ncbi:MAG: hypothetical protein LBU74_01035 [Methanobacteriaceae archaeon]|jgi:hypothetical protein|nr:hypothetical protein [Candidatus Methanorudis spinitermitis]
MGSQGFEPRSWDFSCLSTPIDHHTDDIDYHTVSYAFFSSKTTGISDDFFYFFQFLELRKIHKLINYTKIINNIKFTIVRF